jgi:hypothetical protein
MVPCGRAGQQRFWIVEGNLSAPLGAALWLDYYNLPSGDVDAAELHLGNRILKVLGDARSE